MKIGFTVALIAGFILLAFAIPNEIFFNTAPNTIKSPRDQNTVANLPSDKPSKEMEAGSYIIVDNMDFARNYNPSKPNPVKTECYEEVTVDNVVYVKVFLLRNDTPFVFLLNRDTLSDLVDQSINE